MGERKNLNKYHPPDFDPKKIHRIKKPKNQQKKIRFMLPVRVRCNTCGNYMSEGTKFNCRDEDVITETYLGIKIHRFYIKCTKCLEEVTIKTDPRNESYTVESGASCLYNGHKEKKQEETENALESLEKRTVVSKREIEVMAGLDELKSMKSRRASVSVDSMLEALSRRKKQEEENVEEELLIKSIQFGKRSRIDEEKNYEKKKPKRRESGKFPIKISSVCIISKKTGLESLYHNYGTDSDEEK
ncbi:CWC16 protein [Arabidopsis thaliana x Arabidopsis arenosa]|uniref:Splicing factor YJU2 n=1 Tax=Arabidopsis thaliana x Arabidopsis arenosa TaxID=1240361 RepID=A0A8T1ZK49_9BRAS|nr:CWC16 protein [Arabidopsis thaliana x Arabidopsis arenosa]